MRYLSYLYFMNKPKIKYPLLITALALMIGLGAGLTTLVALIGSTLLGGLSFMGVCIGQYCLRLSQKIEGTIDQLTQTIDNLNQRVNETQKTVDLTNKAIVEATKTCVEVNEVIENIKSAQETTGVYARPLTYLANVLSNRQAPVVSSADNISNNDSNNPSPNAITTEAQPRKQLPQRRTTPFGPCIM